MTLTVCGVDAGTLTTPSYVAWLSEQTFVLDQYVVERERPLPSPPSGVEAPRWIAFDAPQGLPSGGRLRRTADDAAGTPTRKLPSTRTALAEHKAYRGLIELGLEVFWWTHERGLASILGIPSPQRRHITIAETYPRYVIGRLWPSLEIPSKRKAPYAYVVEIWERLVAQGYACRGVAMPTVDQIDAMLCALAAAACAGPERQPPGSVGSPPVVDEEERVLREGFIVSP